MASLTTCKKTGNRRILFVDPDTRERRPIALGKMPIKAARTVLHHVDELVGAKAARAAMPLKTAEWLAEIGDTLYGRLEGVDLVAPRVRLDRTTLGALLERWEASLVVKDNTLRKYRQVADGLRAYFGEDAIVSEIDAQGAEEWRAQLKEDGYAGPTISKYVIVARSIFARAARWRMTRDNPFADVKAGAQTNRDRLRFVSREDIGKVLEACPTNEWRLIFALARFGGVRCPSEVLALRWGDINWERGRIVVRCVKTADAGRAERVIPLFPEIKPYLLQAFEDAPDGAEHVFERRAMTSANLRTHARRIIRRAGLAPWPRTFHNLRSSRAIELAHEHPAHVVSGWMGHSIGIAHAHYLTVLDADFDRAASKGDAPVPTPSEGGAESGARAAQNEAQHVPARERGEAQNRRETPEESGFMRFDAEGCASASAHGMPPKGLEPLTR